MPAAKCFDAVVLRAVDEMDRAVREAALRASERVLIVGTARQSGYAGLADGFRLDEPLALPESNDGILWVARRC
jgi:hypothetical protein